MPRSSTFTTYLNVAADPREEAAFQRFEQRAVKTYSSIASAAQQATRAAAGLSGGAGTAGLGNASRALTAQQNAIRSVTRASSDLAGAQDRQARSTRAAGAAASDAARRNGAFAQSLRATATTLQVVQGPLGPLAGRVTAVANALEHLTGFRLGIAGVGATLFALGRQAVIFSQMESRLRPLYDSQTKVNAAIDDIVGIAGRARVPLQAVLDLYSKLALVGPSVGLSPQRISRLVETATKAAALSGGSRETQSAGLLQFSQAIGSNRLGGDEFRSVMENLPALAKAIADGFKNADGSIGTTIGNLKLLSQQGELTTAAVSDALDRSAGKIDEMARRMPQTVALATTQLLNNITVAIGKLDQSIGGTSTIAAGITLIAQNLNNLAGVAVGVGAAVAAIKLPTLLGDLAVAAKGKLDYVASIREVAQRRKEAADASLAQHEREIAALKAEQAQIGENIALLEREKAVAARDVARYTPAPEIGYAGSPRRLSQAQSEEAGVNKRLNTERLRLVNTSIALKGANEGLEIATKRVAVATAEAGARSGFFKNALGLLVGALDPIPLLIGAAVTVLYELATAESQAEANARTMADSQRKLAEAIDFNTGKLIEQNKAKLASLQIDAQGGHQAAQQNYRQLRGNLLGDAANIIRGQYQSGDKTLRPALQEAYTAFRQYSQGASSISELGTSIDGLVKREPRLKGLLDLVQKSGGAIVDAARENNKFVGQLGLLAGDNSQRNRSFAQFGDNRAAPTQPGKPGTPVTAALARAKAEAEALSQGADTIAAANKRYQAAILGLNAEFGIKDGKIPAGREQEYFDRVKQLKAQNKAEVDQIKAGAKAAAAARKEARHQEAVDRADERTDAANKRDAALLDLEQRKATLSQAEYNSEKVKILAVYDQEIAKIDDTASHSSRAAAQMIANAREVARVAEQEGQKLQQIIDRSSDEPSALKAAMKDVRDIQKMVGTAVNGVAFIGKTPEQVDEIKKTNPLGTAVLDAATAQDLATKRIEEAKKPLRTLTLEYERQMQIQGLILQGRDREAKAYEIAYQQADQIGKVTEDEYQTILSQVIAEEKVNNLVERRGRLVSAITGAVDEVRQGLEDLIVSFPERGFSAAGDFFKNMQRRVMQINASQLVDRLLGNADERVKDLLSGRSAIESKTRFFANKMAETGTAAGNLAAAMNAATQAVQAFASAAQGEGGGPAGAGPIGGANLQDAGDIAKGIGTSVAAAIAPALGAQVSPAGTIVVNGTPPPSPFGDTSPLGKVNLRGLSDLARVSADIVGKALPSRSDRLPSGTDTIKEITKSIGSSLDHVFGTKTFFKGLGGAIGDAVGGAATGAAVNQFMKPIGKALGIKTSNTGAQIGGAIGKMTGIPGADVVGAFWGSIIGGLFKHTPRGGVTIGAGQFGQLDIVGSQGNKKNLIAEATTAADGLIGTIGQIADQLGGSINAAAGRVTIGIRDGNYRVDPTGSGNLKVKKGAIDFGKDEQAAIQAAIKDLISDGVITGISQASQNILRSGRDLQTSIEKAALIESIPQRLEQKTDPVRYAVDQLNREFVKMIEALKEGGATTQQFADAQKLYELERADAIKQATQEAGQAIDDFLKDMKGGSDSPLNRRTVYDNAKTALGGFTADIQAGKIVDQNDLLNAARNFEDASRQLYGSSKGFFDDFNFLFDLLSKARDNAGLTDSNIASLPPSPFSTDPTVQAAINAANQNQVAAINDQTAALLAGLGDISGQLREFLNTATGGGGGRGSALSMLPMVRAQ